MEPIKFSVQAQPRDVGSWLALARRVQAAGLHALMVADHPGSGPTPWPALGAAAAVTDTLRLGTYVLQCGVRDPVQAAADAATLDVLAPGRVVLGMGAGHTFAEWEAVGATRPSPPDRAGRLAEFVNVVADLLDGETVNHAGVYLNVVNAKLDDLPVGRVTLLVGGGHPMILRVAAERADVVALSGLGRTLPDGHRHEVRWTNRTLMSQLHQIHTVADANRRRPEIEALVQQVTATDDRATALARLRDELPDVTVDDLADTPFLLVGTVEQMAAQVRRQADEYGITSYVVRESALDTVEQLLPLVADPAV